MNAKKKINKIKMKPKIRVFLILLVLAAFYWFFNSLSEQYNYLTSYEITYENIPEDLLFQSKPSDQILVQIEATGFEILGHKLQSKNLVFDVSEFKSLGNYKYYYLPNNHKFKIQKQRKDLNIVQFNKDSLIIYLGNLKTKKVPIISAVQLSFKPGFKLEEELQIQPDSIYIKGPEKYIDSIHFIKTNALDKNNINSNINLEIPLLLPTDQDNKLVFETSTVALKGKVAKYTEGTKELTIALPLLPEGVKMELYPKIAIIKYEVSFENYQKIDADSFVLTCDFPTDHVNTDEAISLYLSKKPEFIKEYTIEPEKVTYLIQQLKLN